MASNMILGSDIGKYTLSFARNKYSYESKWSMPKFCRAKYHEPKSLPASFLMNILITKGAICCKSVGICDRRDKINVYI